MIKPGSTTAIRFSVSISTRFSIALPFWGPIYGRVTGWAFVDANANGKFDSGEKPVPNLLLSLAEKEAITGANGRFAFWPVRPGRYELWLQEVPAGLAPNLPLPLSLAIGVGERAVLLPFTSYSSISGFVYNDANQNGRRDPGEPGIPGVVIVATGAFGERRTSTGITGRFNLKVAPGLVKVSLVESSFPKRFVPTTKTHLTLSIGERESRRVEFGAYQKPREIIFTFGPPTARFRYFPEKPSVGAEVVFDASGSEAIGTTLVSFEWEFRHGMQVVRASGKRVTIAFGKVGRWRVRLTVKDAKGLENTHEIELVVEPG